MKLMAILSSLLIVSISGYSQTSFKKSDYTNRRTNKPDYCYEALFHGNDGMGKMDSIIVQLDRRFIDSLHLSDSLLLGIIYRSSLEAKYSLKEKTSYEINHGERPIFSVYTDHSGKTSISGIWYYIGQNSYGAKKSSTLIATFDMEGKFINSTTMDQ